MDGKPEQQCIDKTFGKIHEIDQVTIQHNRTFPAKYVLVIR